MAIISDIPCLVQDKTTSLRKVAMLSTQEGQGTPREEGLRLYKTDYAL